MWSGNGASHSSCSSLFVGVVGGVVVDVVGVDWVNGGVGGGVDVGVFDVVVGDVGVGGLAGAVLAGTLVAAYHRPPPLYLILLSPSFLLCDKLSLQLVSLLLLLKTCCAARSRLKACRHTCFGFLSARFGLKNFLRV